MKSYYILDKYDTFWVKKQTAKGDHVDISKAREKNAIVDLAEDVKHLEKRIEKLINLNNLKI